MFSQNKTILLCLRGNITGDFFIQILYFWFWILLWHFRKNLVKLMECRIQIRFQNCYNPRLLLSFQLAIAVPFQAVLIFVAFLTIFRLTRILLLLPCLYEFTIQSHPVSSLWINLLRDVFIDAIYKNVLQIFREIDGVQKFAELWYLIEYPNP